MPGAYTRSVMYLQILFFEQKIEVLHITRSMQDRAGKLAEEMKTANEQLTLTGILSSLSLQLYSWYIQHGVARNEKDEKAVREFFESQLPVRMPSSQYGFYENLYLYQCYSWYAFIGQDFLSYYRYTHRWVDLFEKEPEMIDIETAHYIKGMHNLLGAHFDLLNYPKFVETLDQFENFFIRILSRKMIITGFRLSCICISPKSISILLTEHLRKD